MPNRFYVPTPTEYTSQFVEKQYPFGEMLALEEKKTQRAENISAGVGELESLLGPLTIPGIFTQEESQKIKPILQQRIIDYTERHQDDMTSLNAIRDLTKLRGEILGDPVVQAIQYDRENLTPQYNQVRLNRESNLDIDPNLQDPNKPELGVRQWHPGEPYPTIQPLQGYVDWQKPIQNLFNQMTPNKVSNVVNEKTKDGIPYIAIRTDETLTDTDFEKVAKGIVTDMTKGNIQGDTEAADSYKRNFKLRYGREPDFVNDYDIILKDVMDQSPAFRVNRSDLSNVNWGTTSGEDKTKTPEELGGGEMTLSINRSVIGDYKPTGIYRSGRKGTIKTETTAGTGLFRRIGKGLETAEAWIGTDHKENLAKVNEKYANDIPALLRNDPDEDNIEQVSEGYYLHPEMFTKYTEQIKPEMVKDSSGVEVFDPSAKQYNDILFAKAGEDYLNEMKDNAIQLPIFPIEGKGGEKYMNDLISNNITYSVSEKGGKNVTTWDDTGFNAKSPYYIEWNGRVDDRKTISQLRDKLGFNGIVFKGTLGNQNPYWPMAVVGNIYTGKGPNRQEKEKQIVRFNPTWISSETAPGDLHDWTGWNYTTGINPRSIMPLDPNDFMEFDAQGLRNKPIDEQKSYLERKRIPYVYTVFNEELSDYVFADGTKSSKKLPRYYVAAYGYDNEGNPGPVLVAEGVTREESWNNYTNLANNIGK